MSRGDGYCIHENTGTLRNPGLGHHNVIALMGSSLADPRADLLREHFRSAVLMLDGDTAGWLATEAITRRLEPPMKVDAIQPLRAAGSTGSKEIHSLLSGTCGRGPRAASAEWARCITVVQVEYNRVVPTRRRSPVRATRASVRQSVTIPAQLAREVRRVAKERNVTMSRALVTLAERGVEAEVAARARLTGVYDKFMTEGDPVRKSEAGADLIRAIFGRDAIAGDPLR